MKLIETNKGAVPCQIETFDGLLRLHVFHTPGGAGLFLVFPLWEEQKAANAARQLIEAGTLKPNVVLTDKVPGCIAAGTVPAPKIQFGIPDVTHANTNKEAA